MRKCVAALARLREEAEEPPRRDHDHCVDFDDIREDERFAAFRKGL